MAGRAAPSLPVQATSGTLSGADQSERGKAVLFLFTLRKDVFPFNPLVCMSDGMMDAKINAVEQSCPLYAPELDLKGV